MNERNFGRKSAVCLVAAVVFLSLAFPLAEARGQAQSGTAADEAALRQIVAGFSDGWNRHDAHSMCVALAEDGEFVSWRGEIHHGRKAFEEYHASLFAGLYKSTHRTDTVKSIRFLSADIASVDDYWSMTG